MNIKKVITAALLLIILIALYFGAVYLKQRGPIGNQPDFKMDDKLPEPVKQYDAVNNIYTSPEHKFSFAYSKRLKAGVEDYTFIPTKKSTQIDLETQLVYEINKQYCAPSGECRPTTQNFGFGVSVIDSSIPMLKKNIEQPLEEKLFGTIKVYTMSQGVEGEGINYYFIPLTAGETLMFDQRYLDENILISYKKVQDFIPLAEQNAMMEAIIKSLTITK